MLVVLLAAGFVQAVAVTVGFRDFGFDPGKAGRATAEIPAVEAVVRGRQLVRGPLQRRHLQLRDLPAQRRDPCVGVDGRHRRQPRQDQRGLPVRQRDATSSTSRRRGLMRCRLQSDARHLQRRHQLLSLHGQYRESTRPASTCSMRASRRRSSADHIPVRGRLGRRRRDRDHRPATPTASTSAGPDSPSRTRRTPTTSVAYSTNAADTTWSAPVLINQGEDGQDNTSALVAFGANVGIYYTDLHAASAPTTASSRFTPSAPPGTSGARRRSPPRTAPSSTRPTRRPTAAGNVYVAIKTNSAAEQIRLLRRTAAGVWSQRGVADRRVRQRRPQVAIDPTVNGGVGAAIVS